MLDSGDAMLVTMAGSFGYAAPEVMLKKGHGKPVDLWSLGVITYTLLCGYSPFRSENLPDLIEECSTGRVIFHERYWKEVSKDAKDFIGDLLQPEPEDRPNSEVGAAKARCSYHTKDANDIQEALRHRWLKGETATDHDILPEIKSFIAKARLKRGIEMVKLSNRIEALKMQEDEDNSDLPTDTSKAAAEGATAASASLAVEVPQASRRLSKAARAAIFKEVVLAKVKEMKNEEAKTEAERTLTELTDRSK